MALTRRQLLSASLSAAAFAAAARLSPARAADAAPPPGKDRAAPGRKRILILGGTGFLGPALVEAARARGHVLTLFNRGKTNPQLFPDLEKLRGDRDGKLDALRGRTWDAVIDDSGYVPRIVGMSAELLAPAVKRYLFVSSVSVYRDDVPKGSDEGAALQTVDDPKNEDVRANYGALKALSEKAAEAALPGRTLVVRPGLIVGPGDPTDRFTYWPVRLDRGGEVLAPGDGSDPVQVVDVRDLAAWMIALVEREATGTFNAAGPDGTLTMAAMLEACRPLAAPGARLAWVPWPFLEKEKVAPWGDLPAWIPAALPEGAIATVSNRRAVAAGLRFRPVAGTAKDTLAWWKAQPAERRAKLRAGLSPDREREVLGRWHADGEKRAPPGGPDAAAPGR